MNIIKIGLVLLTGAGFGIGFDKLADTEILANDVGNYPESADIENVDEANTNEEYVGFEHMNEVFEEGWHMNAEYCHEEGLFLEYMLENLSAEDKFLVEEMINQLLVEYGVTLQELNDDYNIRYDFMIDLMEFINENQIDYHESFEFHNDTDQDYWRNGMGMR
ncbi:MAG: hypothetical protein QM489_03800 [Candidatus Izemoplasma sp.]